MEYQVEYGYHKAKRIRILGHHPEIGLCTGVANTRMDFQCYLFLRFASSSEPYTFRYREQSFTSQKYLGGGIELEWGKKIWFRMRSEMTIHTGFVVDVYSAPNKDQVYSDKSISAFYFSPGFSFRVRPEKLGKMQFTVQARFHLFLADIGELKGPQGNSFSLRLVFSHNWRDFRKSYLKRLSYSYSPSPIFS